MNLIDKLPAATQDAIRALAKLHMATTRKITVEALEAQVAEEPDGKVARSFERKTIRIAKALTTHSAANHLNAAE